MLVYLLALICIVALFWEIGAYWWDMEEEEDLCFPCEAIRMVGVVAAYGLVCIGLYGIIGFLFHWEGWSFI